jgi:hypothetical protein
MKIFQQRFLNNIKSINILSATYILSFENKNQELDRMS